MLLNYENATTGETSQKAVRVSASRGDTVADLKRRVAKAEAIPEGTPQLVVFNGQRLEDLDQLDKCGLAAADGSEEWADQAIYPNCWFLLAHRKAFAKALDPLWPVVRPLQQPGDVFWCIFLILSVVTGSVLL